MLAARLSLRVNMNGRYPPESFRKSARLRVTGFGSPHTVHSVIERQETSEVCPLAKDYTSRGTRKEPGTSKLSHLLPTCVYGEWVRKGKTTVPPRGRPTDAAEDCPQLSVIYCLRFLFLVSPGGECTTRTGPAHFTDKNFWQRSR